MRKLLLGILTIFIAVPAFSEAPELKMVMPNSWQKLTRVSGNEAEAVLDRSEAAVQQVYKKSEYDIRDQLVPAFKKYTVYRQTEDSDVFYRILISEEKIEDCLASKDGFVQAVCYQGTDKNILLMSGMYGVIETRDQRYFVYDSLDIIKRKETKTYGLLCCKTRVSEDGGNIIKNCKNQTAGKEEGDYFIIKDLEQVVVSSHSFWNLLPDAESISISASDCLVDDKSPLKYGLQNAFDGDPSTSFVENTEDDLMKIKFDILALEVNNINMVSIINGYALSNELYKKNNRLKGGEIESYKLITEENQKKLVLNPSVSFICKDDLLKPQYYTFNIERNGAITIKFTSVYRGKKYNDTCLSEINLRTIDSTWLFGDINE